jgi:ATP-dependent exoDNAse (exonuclease V) beta subunit
MDLGSLVHAILKTYPVQAPATQISEMLDRLLQQTPKIRLLKSENERAVKDDLARFLRGPVWGRLAGNPSLQREVPFVIALRGDGLEVFVKGQIDALTIEEKGPLLLDFKYAFFDENHSANYALPLETYSLTLMKSMGFKTTETALVFLRERANGIISTTVGNPERIEKRLISLAQAYQRKVFLNDMNVWQKIERNRCNTLKCGFRSYCWDEKEK